MTHLLPRRKDYLERRSKIETAICSPLTPWLTEHYSIKLWSADQISEHFATFDILVNPRSITRWLKLLGIPVRARTGEAYRNAMKTGRMRWALKDPRLKSKVKQVQSGLRYMILKRDGYKCVLCGATAKDTVLEVDHVIAKTNGGTNDPSNLRVLCHDCNFGKRNHEKEK